MLGPLDRNHSTAFWLFWVKAKNRVTGADEYGGIWTGPTERLFTISGQGRTYLPGGSIVGLDRISYVAGAQQIQSQRVELNAVTPAIETLLRTFEARQAEFEIHRARPNSPLSLSGAWSVEQAFKGRIDDIKFPRSAADLEGGGSLLKCIVTLMSASRMGTRTLQLRKSDTSQRLTDPNDKGRQYSSSKAKVTWMGEVKDTHRADNNYNAMRRLMGG